MQDSKKAIEEVMNDQQYQTAKSADRDCFHGIYFVLQGIVQ